MPKLADASSGFSGLDGNTLVSGGGRRPGATIVNRIRRDNPEAARQVADVIYGRCASLENFPERGRIGRTAGTRELVFAPLPYIVVYRVKPSAVEIVRIYHGAQNWP